MQPEKESLRQAHRSPQRSGRRPERNLPDPAWDSPPWPGLDTRAIDNLAMLAERAPGAYKQLMAREASRRRLEWAGLMAQAAGHLCGLAALVVLAAVAWHAIDRGAPTQAASIICTGAVSIVALFVTGRKSVNPRSRKRPARD
jgi:hypothetical protein